MVFLRRVVPGTADKAYGIHVAQLAGLPLSVVLRARSLLQEYEGGGGAIMGGMRVVREQVAAVQLPLFGE